MSAVLACTSWDIAFITVPLVVAFLLLAYCHARVPYKSSDK